MRNVEALQATLDFIEKNPDVHDQSSYGRRYLDGTIRGCFAYHAMALSGQKIVMFSAEHVHATALFEQARQYLGLTQTEAEWLFEADHTVTKLRTIVEFLISE